VANKPIDEGSVDTLPIVFKVDGKIYEGFKNVRLTRSLTSLTGSFEIVLTDKFQIQKEDFTLKPGLSIECSIGTFKVFTGYIDQFAIHTTANSRNITISGRDKTGDLVDCSVASPNEFNNMDILQIANKICSPFGIGVKIFGAPGSKIEKFTIQQAETAFEALERLAKKRDFLITSAPDGDLVLEKKGVVRSGTDLIEGENTLAISCRFDNTERFSKYIVKGQSTSLLGGIGDATSGKGEASDQGIERYRPLVIIAESSSKVDDCKKRASWEANMRAARSTEISVLTRGWIKEDGLLWASNQLVNLDSISSGIKQQFLISEIKMEQSDRGRLTELSLIRPDAFEFKEDVEKEKDPLDTLGWD